MKTYTCTIKKKKKGGTETAYLRNCALKHLTTPFFSCFLPLSLRRTLSPERTSIANIARLLSRFYLSPFMGYPSRVVVLQLCVQYFNHINFSLRTKRSFLILRSDTLLTRSPTRTHHTTHSLLSSIIALSENRSRRTLFYKIFIRRALFMAQNEEWVCSTEMLVITG